MDAQAREINSLIPYLSSNLFTAHCYKAIRPLSWRTLYITLTTPEIYAITLHEIDEKYPMYPIPDNAAIHFHNGQRQSRRLQRDLRIQGYPEIWDGLVHI